MGAKAKKAQEEAQANIASTKRSLTSQIAVKTEMMADNVYKIIQGKRQKIADNYLSLKAYAAVAKDKLEDYLSKGGKGRNLSSVGDLLTTVGALSKVKVKKAKGLGYGASKLPMIFSGKVIKVKKSVSKINGLVAEYMSVLKQVRERYPMGLGNYLMAKLETSMQGTGALESTRSPKNQETMCLLMDMPWACLPSCPTLSLLLCTWPTTRRPLLPSLASLQDTRRLAKSWQSHQSGKATRQIK